MKKNIKTCFIVGILIIVWRISQIIFDVFYSTTQNSYLGIQNGGRTQSITPLGYEEQHIDRFTTSKPVPYTTSKIGQFQDKCRYGQGNCIGLLGQQALASFRWINAIQYIAQEVDTSQASDITNRFARLYDINPRRYYPYVLLQYLGNPTPSDKSNTNQIARENTIRLGEKGIQYNCNMNIINKIDQLSYTGFLQALDNTTSEYWYPCKSGGELAHTMAFNYFYYLGDSKKSILYYKVASFHDDVPAITSSMPILIEGKQGNNKTSAYLWYDQFNSALSKYQNKENLNPDEIASLESSMEKSLQKMVSEYSLYLLTTATNTIIQQSGDTTCAHSLSCITQQGYMRDIINTITKTCKNNIIDCEIIRAGQQQEWITNNGKLIYPKTTNNLNYKRDNNKGQRIISSI